MNDRIRTWQGIAEPLVRGEPAVIPTDTLYGIVGSALQPATVERIYALRQREFDKPMIVLIADLSHLDQLGVTVPEPVQQWLGKVWPGPVSVVLPCEDLSRGYLHRGTRSLAVRWPAKPELLSLLEQVGTIVAPSANWAGKPPARDVAEAYKYFAEEVAGYVDDGVQAGQASALVDARVMPPRILRPAPGFNLTDLYP